MNKLNYILPLLIAIGFNTLSIASESGDESSSISSLSSSSSSVSSSSSKSSKAEAFSVTKDDLSWLLDRVIEDLTSTKPFKKKVSWLSITEQFREAHAERCEGIDDKTLSDKLSIKFANYYRARTGAGNRIWKQRCAQAGIEKEKESKEEEKPKKAPAKRDREEEKEDEVASSSSSESDDDGSGPSSSSRAKKDSNSEEAVTEEDLKSLVKIALDFLISKKRQALDWEQITQLFREKNSERFGFLTDEELMKKLRKKFRSTYISGRRSEEWKRLRLEAGIKVAKSPQERVREKRQLQEQGSASEVEVVKDDDKNPAPLKKAASAVEPKAPVAKSPVATAQLPTTQTPATEPVKRLVIRFPAQPAVKTSEDSSVKPQSPVAAPKKPDSYILSLLTKNTDDAFMTAYNLAIKTRQKCENCVQDGEEQPLLLVVLKLNRFALFKRMVEHPSGADILAKVGSDGKTIKQTLIDYCMANQCFEALPVLLGGDTLWSCLATAFVNGQISKDQFTNGVGQQNLNGVIQQRFSAALKDGREDEIEFWFSSGLLDWSSEVVIEVDTDERIL